MKEPWLCGTIIFPIIFRTFCPRMQLGKEILNFSTNFFKYKTLTFKSLS